MATTDSQKLRDDILHSLEDNKAINPVTINLSPETIWADGIIIASGNSDRHLRSMAEKLRPLLKQHGLTQTHIEGQPGSGWLLLDAGSWIVHLFKPQTRTLYDLESLWNFARPEPEPEQDK
ncbi:MAG: ribosome silencing factor [Alphaproteobacteria bacterium]|nr:ribosome silencing factor [Alphaproteobacteria bacterium]MDA8004176.1 ribosome silencing factor [Alphaproteobacteria bacterium]MDA8006480.1 ribosome silencing factor [Alphaproteobacteria bacterium]MDA8013911.1 ribosome silencing factor [Alphaproteobacteria bacterium]